MTKTATIHAQQRWEYLTISRKTESYLARELNDLGQEGWEVVTINFAPGHKGEMFWTAFMKRPATKRSHSEAPPTTVPAPHEPAVEQQASVESPIGFNLEGETFDVHEEPKEPQAEEWRD